MTPTPLESLILRDPGERNVAAFWRGNQLEASAASLGTATRVVITTGFPVAGEDGALVPETDGPGAAVALGQALTALGSEVRYVSDSLCAPLLEALGAQPLDAVDWSVSDPELVPKARTYLAEHAPSHLVSIERPGRAADGHYYTMKGRRITEAVSALDELFRLAREQGTPTLGIGDGGNEIGMGGLPVADAVEHGETIASVVATDWTVVAGVSTWGAYALIAALSQAAGRDLLPTDVDVRARLNAVLDAGAVDGVTGRRAPMIDGLAIDVTLEMLEAIRSVNFR
jgi:hypothetical protein